MASTMDMALMRDLFANVDRMRRRRSGSTRRSATRARATRARGCYPYRIGSQGQLLEFFEEFGDPEPQHRHFSHLFGLHPGPPHHRRARRSCSRRCGDRTSCAATAAPAGASPGRSTTGRGCSTAITRSADVGDLLRLVDTGTTNYAGGGGVYAEPVRRAPAVPDRRQLRRDRRHREMLVQSHRGGSTCCRRCRRRGRLDASAACERAAGSRSTSSGPPGSSTRAEIRSRSAAPRGCAQRHPCR